MIEQVGKQRHSGVDRTLLRPREIVESTGLSRVTVYGLISSGEIPSVRVGRAIRVPVQGFKEWLERKAGEQRASL